MILAERAAGFISHAVDLLCLADLSGWSLWDVSDVCLCTDHQCFSLHLLGRKQPLSGWGQQFPFLLFISSFQKLDLCKEFNDVPIVPDLFSLLESCRALEADDYLELIFSLVTHFQHTFQSYNKLGVLGLKLREWFTAVTWVNARRNKEPASFFKLLPEPNHLTNPLKQSSHWPPDPNPDLEKSEPSDRPS